MIRIFDIAVTLAFATCLACAFYLGNAYGFKNGQTAGQLEMYEKNFGAAQYNLYSMDKKK